MTLLPLVLVGCAETGGRVAVILDNSGSMGSVGTSYGEIKQTLLNTLLLLPSSREVGLRVFSDNGSKLVVPYDRNFDTMRSSMAQITPRGGTFIGASLLDAASDLLATPHGDNRLILITDGEGTAADINAAREAYDRIKTLSGEFKCHFLIFSARQNVREETPIGKIADILGCDFAAHDPRHSTSALAGALQRLLRLGFYPLWIILSALAYLTLLVFTANLVFATQFAQGVLARYARLIAIAFIGALLPLVASVHIVGLVEWSPGHMWWLVILALATLLMGFLGLGRRRARLKTRGNDDDPLA